MMLHISYDEIIAIIKKEAGISDDEINKRIKEKLNLLSGLISKEGAAHIVANDLGIKLFDDLSKKRFKINKIIAGMRNLELIGKVVKKFEIREFKKEKSSGKVARLFIGDETGSCRVVFWGKQADVLNDINEGDVIKISNGYVKSNNGFNEVHFNHNSKIEINPSGETIDVIANINSDFMRKKINELEVGDYAEVFGTIVQVFEPRFYEACPECNKRLDIDDGNFKCLQHGVVKEKLALVLNTFVDDGTGNIRAVFFRDIASNLLGLNGNALSELQNNNMMFSDIKDKVMGKQLAITGKVKKNEMFDRLEFVANQIKEINPDVLADTINKEMDFENVE